MKRYQATLGKLIKEGEISYQSVQIHDMKNDTEKTLCFRISPDIYGNLYELPDFDSDSDIEKYMDMPDHSCLVGKIRTQEQTIAVEIWRRNYTPFTLGGPVHKNIKTVVTDVIPVNLGKGFQGIYIDQNGYQGVFELESGGLVGDTIEQVRSDIELCDDIDLMKQQIEIAKKEREKAISVTKDKFFENW